MKNLVLKSMVISMLTCFCGLHGGEADTAPVFGLHENDPEIYAFTGATLYVTPQNIIKNATLIVRKGLVEAVGSDLTVPAEATLFDLKGSFIYPGFIDLFADYGMAKPERGGSRQGGRARGDNTPAADTAPKAVYWNSNVHPEQSAGKTLKPKEKAAKKYRAAGFTTVVSHPQRGVIRGGGALVALDGEEPSTALIEDEVILAASLRGAGFRSYPGSQMGAIALIRQAFNDARWYASAQGVYGKNPLGQNQPQVNHGLEALARQLKQKKPVVFELRDYLEILRVGKLARELGFEAWAHGNGDEYRRLDAVKAAGVKLILPLDFPEAPDVAHPEEEQGVSLREMRHWYFAPENAARLADAGIGFVFTFDGQKKAASFLKQLRLVQKRGLDKAKVLEALTTTPSDWLGMSDRLGSLQPGRLANFIVVDGDLFNQKSQIIDTWVRGTRFEIKPKSKHDLRGEWSMSAGKKLTLSFGGEATKLNGKLKKGKKETDLKKIKLTQSRIAFTLKEDLLGGKGIARALGLVNADRITGTLTMADGSRIEWVAERVAPEDKKDKGEKDPPHHDLGLTVVYPEGAFGRSAPPQQPDEILIRNATVWTSAEQGRLEEADLLVRHGKIAQVGKNLQAGPDALIIDGTGKHVTPGLIDEHSHTAISGGVNEGSHAITAEVSIAEVVNSDDIAIYRELAGGLTTINQLHGSANPIGGQNSVIKLRWGATPDEMVLDGRMPGIKFALGENVKQSNWGDNFTTRYPQTRMGVEQFFRDSFRAALEYRNTWETYEKDADRARKIPPRKDFRLETLLQIIDGKRQVHCHSYRGDEILALMRVAEDFGFKIDTFTHVLEGYKIAKELKEHGAMASCFSDWWAYKFEVIDAIPYNGALMHNAGVVVSFNSDSNELARRLNSEAAKAVKYGGIAPEEALKFVTLNPAKQLRIDHRVGSLEKGKDADFVIWSGSPLSTYTRCEQTWIDGRKYFDRGEDLEQRSAVAKQRRALVQHIMEHDKGGDKSKKGKKPETQAYSCCRIHQGGF